MPYKDPRNFNVSIKAKNRRHSSACVTIVSNQAQLFDDVVWNVKPQTKLFHEFKIESIF